MPNFDGGHYFYTGLFPVALGPVPRGDGSITVPSHLLREALALLPNFSQVREEEDAQRKTDRISPFARCRSTHFVRLAVIDDPAFNGRDGGNAILQAAKGVDLHAHQPVDHLSRAWLLFTADFDVADEDARDRWAAGLWQLMEPELHAIFRHCRGFEGVGSGEAFAAYLARGQIETTMSFNDYYLDPPAFAQPMKQVGLGALAVLALALLAGWWIEDRTDGGWPVWLAAALIGVLAALYTAYQLILRFGARPFPAAPDSDLKSVLKGLYLKEHLTRFAIAQQGASPDALYAAFGALVAEVRPDQTLPTQPPGVLRA